MRVAIATVQVPFVRGGAEMLAENLCAAVREAGHEAEIVSIPFKWYPACAIPPQMLACRMLDLSESMGTRIDRVVGLKFPAYLVPHDNKVQWVLHQHRGAYDLWERRWGDLYGAADGAEVREAIQAADTALLGEARRVFAISRNVAERLHRFNGIEAETLYHPPPLAGQYRGGPPGDYLLLPSRLNAIKRQDLVVEALALTRRPVRAVFVGAADDPAWAAAVMARAEQVAPGRVSWLGAVPDERKVELLAGALGVVVPPLDEDYGYVTLEAMLSARAVITLSDAGGPLEFVEHGCNGLVCEPDPAALAEAMDQLWADRTAARRLGEEGMARYGALGLSWEGVVRCLLG